jgi:hypothetical protein
MLLSRQSEAKRADCHPDGPVLICYKRSITAKRGAFRWSNDAVLHRTRYAEAEPSALDAHFRVVA